MHLCNAVLGTCFHLRCQPYMLPFIDTHADLTQWHVEACGALPMPSDLPHACACMRPCAYAQLLCTNDLWLWWCATDDQVFSTKQQHVHGDDELPHMCAR